MAAARGAVAPRVDAHGVAHLPATSVRASRFMSAQSRSNFIELFSHPEAHPPGADVAEMRERDERKNAPFVARAEALYPVNIEPKLIGGVRTRVITPKSGVAPENRARVLINLHGGGFVWGEGNGALTQGAAQGAPCRGYRHLRVFCRRHPDGGGRCFPGRGQRVGNVQSLLRPGLIHRPPGAVGRLGRGAGQVPADPVDCRIARFDGELTVQVPGSSQQCRRGRGAARLGWRSRRRSTAWS
jgi:epsilon-lactone hydrolase